MSNSPIVLDSSSDEDDLFESTLNKAAVVSKPRPFLHHDSSSSDESLEILPPKATARFGKEPWKNPSKKPASQKFDSSSDSEDSLLMKKPSFKSRNPPATAAQRRKEQAQKRALERQEEKKRRDAEKEALKKDKRQKAQEAKERREAEKLALQQSKRQRVQEAQQNMGKFAHQEIVLLMDSAWMREPWTDVVDNLKDSFLVHEYRSALGGNAVQWIRKDYSQGGATDAWESMLRRNGLFEHMDRIVMMFEDPKSFIRLLQRNEDQDDYPRLKQWLDGMQAGWKAAWCPNIDRRPKVVLLLYRVKEELDRMWVTHRRSRSKDTPPPTEQEFQDAISWLLVTCTVECVPCTTHEEVRDFIFYMTRALCEGPYKKQTHELECVKKIKSWCDKEEATPLERATDCWRRQLQQLPGMSQSRAEKLVKSFPTAQSLWRAYQDESIGVGEKRMLVSTLMGGNSQQAKISDLLFRLMTSSNPGEFV